MIAASKNEEAELFKLALARVGRPNLRQIRFGCIHKNRLLEIPVSANLVLIALVCYFWCEARGCSDKNFVNINRLVPAIWYIWEWWKDRKNTPNSN